MLRQSLCPIAIVLAVLGLNVSTTVIASQARPASGPTVKVCSLLSRDLAMKVSTAAAQKEFDYAKPVENYLGQELGGSRPASCSYGAIVLVLNPLAQPDHVRNLLRTRTKPYEKFEPVAGIGDAAFFEGNKNFANLYVWTGSRHFHIEMSAASSEHGKDLKPNAIALANAVIPQLR